MPRTKKEKSSLEHDPPTLPSGLELAMSLPHEAPVSRLGWSPDGDLFATGSDDGFLSIWNGEARSHHIRAHNSGGVAMSWAPDGSCLATVANDQEVVRWTFKSQDESYTRQKIGKTKGGMCPQVQWLHSSHALLCVADTWIFVWDLAQNVNTQNSIENLKKPWSTSISTDGQHLIVCSDAGAFILNRPELSASIQPLVAVRCFSSAWAPNSESLAITGQHQTSVFNRDFELKHVIEHDYAAWANAWTPDGRLLAAFGGRGDRAVLEIWDSQGWARVVLAELGQIKTPDIPPSIAFHPTRPLLACSTGRVGGVTVFSYDRGALLRSQGSRKTTHYMNAKVVLVGNTSVGKSGLGLVLTGKNFRPTESTHGRRVWQLSKKEVPLAGDIHCEREVLLWDLAGQPGYRLIHQLYLSEVAVALVLFDSRSETDPFAGVAYWARALDEATHGFPLIKMLVASRIDRGGPGVSRERIEQVLNRYGFHAFVEVSAKRGDGIAGLRELIAQRINWGQLPQISSSEIFKATKDFLIRQKKRGSILVAVPDLLEKFRRSAAGREKDLSEGLLRGCLGQLEIAGLVRRLSFGDQVLLQPELLDDYCGWLAMAARQQPDGLGFIKEEAAKLGRFDMDHDRRLRGRPEEKTLLIAMTEEVVGRNIAYRQDTEQGPMLVFPSELNADLPDYPGGYSLAVAFSFEGPLSGIYATLTVSLINSTAFKKKALYKNAALLLAARDQVCGFAVEFPDKSNDSLGRLVVFFETDVDKSTRLLFLRYVNRQLERLALANTVRRERIYHCGKCNYTVPQEVVEKRRKNEETTVLCPVCQRAFPLDDLAEQSAQGDVRIQGIEATSREEQERQRRLTTLDERSRSGQYHVFLCHNSKDKDAVRQVAERLKEQGILPWFDETVILAGDRFTDQLEDVITKSGVVAIFIGPQGIGRWQKMEYQAALIRFIEKHEEAAELSQLRLIPVLLPGLPKKVSLPPFLSTLHAIDLRKEGADTRDELRKLVVAILSGELPFAHLTR